MHTVFAVDALASSHPLSCGEEEVREPAQISQMFSSISYRKVCRKVPELLSFLGAAAVTCCSSGSSLRCLLLGFQGAAVLRMLSDFLTESVFTRGVSVSNLLAAVCEEWQTLVSSDALFCSFLLSVLPEHVCIPKRGGEEPVGPPPAGQWLQMSPSHLSITFRSPPQAAEKAPGLNIPHTVHDIMDRWTLQMGFPVVTVDTSTGQVSQKHFLLDPESPVDRPSQFK